MKNPLWKQSNPTDQLTVLLMDLEGTIENFGESVIVEQMKIQQIFSQLHDLKYFLAHPEKW